MAPASVSESCTALATMVSSTVLRSSVEIDRLAHFPQAFNSPTERASSRRARLDLVKQAHILDGDHRLVGEGLASVRSAGRGMARLSGASDKHADGFALAQQRHAKKRPIPAIFCAVALYSGSSCTSGMCTTPSGWRGQTTIPVPARSVPLTSFGLSADQPIVLAGRADLPSQLNTTLPDARTAALRTRPGVEHRLEVDAERLMTWSTSAVAVCCSSASSDARFAACTSSKSRTFSMAITAWSAKVLTRSICWR